MQATESPVLRDIVLVGGGHSHVGVLRRFGMQPLAGVRLTLICNATLAPYSGMLPGYVAGHYSHDDIHIDLDRLAQFAGARLYRAEVTGIDRAARQVLCRDRPPVPYDLLSLNIGATPQLDAVPGAAEHAVAVKPIQQFNQRWLALLARVRAHAGRTTIAVVGGGAGGVELVLAMAFRLRGELRALGRDPAALAFHLVTGSAQLLPTHNRWVRQKFARVLAEHGITVHLGAAVQSVAPGLLQMAGGASLAADEIVWVTQAGGPAWLRGTGLALDASGFVQVNDQLQSLSDPLVFAAGDVAAMVRRPLEKAGVFAVRQGAPLAHNLRRAAQGRPLCAYRPQRHWLALVSTGGPYAVASRGPVGFAGAWVWQWKDWIDRRFMRRFSELPVMGRAGFSGALLAALGARLQPAARPPALQADEARQAAAAVAMRCGGCGAKVASTVLARALGSLVPAPHADVLIGLNAPDDAAVVRVPPGMAMVHTVDFFRAFVSDPYLFGQIAANHALGDIFAMGAQPQTATAIATLPPGLDAKVQDLLFQMMSGALRVLDAAGCALVGGHSGEGRELALGFAINGLVDGSLAGVMRKGGMRAGDALVLTKPLGTGTLLAAQARLGARAQWVDGALQSMLASSQHSAQILRAHGATACTDVTGFGLLGHLVEMLRQSGLDARLHLNALPLLEGARETAAAGLVSSLHESNLRAGRALQADAAQAQHPAWPLLFDPQTAGGLLASVPADRAGTCLQALHESGHARAAAVIGWVVAADGSGIGPDGDGRAGRVVLTENG